MSILLYTTSSSLIIKNSLQGGVLSTSPIGAIGGSSPQIVDSMDMDDSSKKRRQSRRDSLLPDQAQVKAELDEAIDKAIIPSGAVNLISDDESGSIHLELSSEDEDDTVAVRKKSRINSSSKSSCGLTLYLPSGRGQKRSFSHQNEDGVEEIVDGNVHVQHIEPPKSLFND